MGQFIDTQQGLLTEAKQKRLEREQKQKDKLRQQEQERSLFFTLDNILYNEPETQKEKIFKKLHYTKTRDEIIDQVTNFGSIEDTYILTKKYNNILSSVYNGYKYQDKEQEAENISPYDYILNNGEELESRPEKKNNHILLYLLGIPLHFIICLFYFATRPRKRKRR